MKDDLGKYIQRRKHADKAFAKGFEPGYAKIKKMLISKTTSSDRVRSRTKCIA